MDKLLVLGSVSLSGALLAGITALLSRMLRGRISARAAYGLWLLVLLRFLCPWTTPHSLMTQAADPPQELLVVALPEEAWGEELTGQEEADTGSIAPEVLLWAVWGAGAGVVLAVRAVSYARFSQKIRRTARPTSQSAQAVYQTLTTPYRRAPKLVCSPAAATPMLIGLVRPTIVLPCRALDSEAMEALLSHELTHWRRHDIAVKWFAVIATVVHWFNPVAWWLVGRLDRACELACDEQVCRGWDLTRRARYGQLLLEFCAAPNAGFAACLSQKQCLKERLIHIMNHKRKPFAGVLAAAACVAVLLTSVALGAYAAPEDTPPKADASAQIEQGETILQWPMAAQGSVVLSQPFGSRAHPITGKTTEHSGIDIVLDAGTPVLAAAGGRVAETGFDPENGRYIVLDHGSLTTKYCHLLDVQVAAGETVSAGQTIGAVGQTGMSAGPHLHFEVTRDGSLTDPLSLLPHAQMEAYH